MSDKKKSIKLNAILNGSRTLSLSVFSLLTYLYVSRIFGVELIGGYGFITTSIGYYSLLANLGIKEYAAREGSIRRHDSKAISQFASQIFTINMILTLFAYLAIGVSMFVFESFQHYKVALLLQSSLILFTTLGVEWIYTVYEDFLFLTVRTLVVQVISLLLTFIFVKSPSDFLLYVAISVFSTCGGYLLNILLIRRHCHISFTTHIDIKKHLKPILILGASSIAINIYLNSDITLLNLLKGEYEAGLYSNAAKCYGIIKTVLNSLALVSIPTLNRLIAENKREEYNNTLSTLIRSLLILIVPIIVGMIVMSREIVVLIGGEKFADSDIALSLLSLALIFAVIACVFTSLVLIIFKKEKYVMYGTMISAAVNFAMNFVFIPLWAEKGAAITTIIAEVVITAYSYYHSREDIKLIGIWTTFIKCIVASVGIVIACLLLKLCFDGLIIRLVICVGVSVITYFGMLLLLQEDICKSEVKKVLSVIKK